MDFDAAYSSDEIAADRKAVEEHDYSTVKKVESMIKNLEAKDTGNVSMKAKF